MNDLKQLLDYKSKMKRKQPKFVRQEYHKRIRLKETWRKPRGVQSKLRLRRRGKPKIVSIGYKMPKAVRGLNKDGSKEILISNMKELISVDKSQIVRLRRVGAKKKITLLKTALKRGLVVSNFRNIEQVLSALENKLKIKKELKKKRIEQKKAQEKKTKSTKKPERKTTADAKEIIEKDVSGLKKSVEKAVKTEANLIEKPTEKPKETLISPNKKTKQAKKKAPQKAKVIGEGVSKK